MGRILSGLSEALGRSIGHGCRVDTMTGCRANALGDVEAGCPPEHHDPVQLGTMVVGDAYQGA